MNQCSCSNGATENTGNMFFRGTWQYCTEYKAGDVVIFNGSLYMALQQSAGKNPSEYQTYWRPLILGVEQQYNEDHTIIDGGYSTPYTHSQTEIRIKRDSSMNWALNNPRLDLGVVGIDMDLHRAKVGNGIDCWNELPYLNDDLYNKMDQVEADFSEIKEIVERYKEEFTDKVYNHIRRREEFLQQQIDKLARAVSLNALDHMKGVRMPWQHGTGTVV